MVFKHRDVLPSIWAVLSLAVASLLGNSYQWEALILILVADYLRIWARSWIGDFTRLRVIQVPQLVTSGPFSFSRNPLYLSNLAVALGWSLFLGFSWLWCVLSLFVLWIHWSRVIREEEIFLRQEFPEYDEYAQSTSRWLSFRGSFTWGQQAFLQSARSDFWTWFWQLGSIILALGALH